MAGGETTMPIHTIVFDGGDTLVVVDPYQTGPMVNWPVLKAVPGVKQMLASLGGNFRLIVGTNATDSDASMVKAAMARLGCEKPFEGFYTPKELGGARKPEPDFFKAIESMLKDHPSELVMVGDSFTNDIEGAIRAGWRAVWYNPSGGAAPGLAPVHDAEVLCMSDLPAVLDRLTLPTVAEAKAWLVEQNGPGRLLAHVEMVAAVAYLMAVFLRKSGEQVDPVLAHRGGLLHDLAKIPARGQNIGHGLLGGEMLRQRGQPLLAEIVSRHVLFDILDQDLRPRTWEEKLVYFADKMVEMERIVSFHDRLAALQQRYRIPTPQQDRDALVEELTRLEAEICEPMHWTPAQLLQELRSAYETSH